MELPEREVLARRSRIHLAGSERQQDSRDVHSRDPQRRHKISSASAATDVAGRLVTPVWACGSVEQKTFKEPRPLGFQRPEARVYENQNVKSIANLSFQMTHAH
jgi:hypothetical protein